MQEIGINGDLNTKVRESLLTFNRLVRFFSQNAPDKLDVEKKSRLLTLLNDITSLNNHADFLSTKVVFLLDATLGMIGIEQNNIIKIFSVEAVIFMPPTLIASIFGMNFHFIPELSWHYGYYYALVLMLISMVISYLFFKTKKWL
jgi:magnesium transporter